MSAQVLIFDVFAGSGKGLMARPILPNNSVCFKTHVGTIEYEIYNVTDGDVPVTGTLDPDVVMFSSVQPWKYDNGGYSFLWAAFGTLWPEHSKIMRVVVRIQLSIPGSPFDGFVFLMVWQPMTKNPAAPQV